MYEFFLTMKTCFRTMRAILKCRQYLYGWEQIVNKTPFSHQSLWCLHVSENRLYSTIPCFSLQELGGNATFIFYGTEEGNEGKTAYLERRPPDFSKFPRRPWCLVPCALTNIIVPLVSLSNNPLKSMAQMSLSNIIVPLVLFASHGVI